MIKLKFLTYVLTFILSAIAFGPVEAKSPSFYWITCMGCQGAPDYPGVAPTTFIGNISFVGPEGAPNYFGGTQVALSYSDEGLGTWYGSIESWQGAGTIGHALSFKLKVSRSYDQRTIWWELETKAFTVNPYGTLYPQDQDLYSLAGVKDCTGTIGTFTARVYSGTTSYGIYSITITAPTE
jgi:hypothetical protein